MPVGKAIPEVQNDEVRRLASLLEVSKCLTDTIHLRKSLRFALELLGEDDSVDEVFILLDTEDAGRELLTQYPEEPPTLMSRARSLGKIADRVIESGKPVIVPKASLEPMLGGRSRVPAKERSLILVPLILAGKTFGILAMELHYDGERHYERALHFVQVVASLVAQAVRVNQLAEAEKRSLVAENLHLREELKQRYDFSNIIGNSNAMREVYERITQVARADTTVLIRGESGTGKELIAHAIHYNSHRAEKPFVRVSCAALPETLIEAELFGHEKGAFTGAQFQKQGRFELASGGTLFLDEIGELQPSLQVKLLRVLQEREFERVGGTQTVRADVRLIAATNKPLEDAMNEGAFREDLYYRLNVFTVFVPPLRERQSDALLLADHFLEKFSGKHGRNIRRISTPAIDMLSSYHWPGNVRELENTIERAVLVCDGHVIHGHHLPPTLQTAEASDTLTTVDLAQAVAAYEKDLLLDALKSTRGNRAKAARILHTTERIIGYKVSKYGIECSRFR
ncbi:MAG: sigma 54-interacting transcriptional regulator [Acidobacteriota bacterium]|nr:MAG: sigma 54-interacting transcriptional regulator [Acidobacteriota bacterium]